MYRCIIFSGSFTKFYIAKALHYLKVFTASAITFVCRRLSFFNVFSKSYATKLMCTVVTDFSYFLQSVDCNRERDTCLKPLNTNPQLKPAEMGSFSQSFRIKFMYLFVIRRKLKQLRRSWYKKNFQPDFSRTLLIFRFRPAYFPRLEIRPLCAK